MGLESSFQKAGMGRAREIEEKNRELGGLFDSASKLSPEANRLIMAEIPHIKELCHGDRDCLVKAMKEVSDACEHATDNLPAGWTHKDMIDKLKAQIEAVESHLGSDKETKH